MRKVFHILLFLVCSLSISGQIASPSVVTGDKLNADLAQYIPQAEIWLLNKGTDSEMDLGKIPYQEVHVNKGFTVQKFERCELRLEEPAGLLPYTFLSTDNYLTYGSTHDFFAALSRNRTPARLTLYIPLYKLSHKKGKPTRRLSKNPQKLGYNKWAVQLKTRKGLPILLMATEASRTEKVYGEILTFVFDDEDAAHSFEAGFRQQIKICGFFRR